MKYYGRVCNYSVLSTNEYIHSFEKQTENMKYHLQHFWLGIYTFNSIYNRVLMDRKAKYEKMEPFLFL